MIRFRLAQPTFSHCFSTLTIASLFAMPIARPSKAAAQDTGPTGVVAGKVTDQQGTAVVGAQVFVEGTSLATQSRNNGDYVITRVPVGAHTVHARLLGYRPEAASVNVLANARVTQDFTLRQDPLQLQTMVVTGTQTPRMNLDASVAVTTLTASEIQAAAPRSTTEMLRYVPGFTRVESSGGEVNENISMRGVLGVEYVAFSKTACRCFPRCTRSS